MKTMNYKKMIFIAPLVIGGLALFVYLIMVLWNWLMPVIFHLPLIGFWQAAGLLLLGRFLFGGLGHKNGWQRNHYSYDVRKKIKNMTPEERAEFFQNMHLNREAWCNKYYAGKPSGNPAEGN